MPDAFPRTSLSVLVPVYNEQHLVAASLERLTVLASSPNLERVEVIVVDDCSSDGTPEVLRAVQAKKAGEPDGFFSWRFLRQERNGGKGRAIRTALEAATCELSVIHDADLEYNPRDLLRIVQVFIDEPADAVFGTRFSGSEVRRVLLYRHQLGNKFLTTLCNLVTNLNLTDMETCYKAVRTDLLKSIPIASNDFRIEPELTIKLAKRRARIFEVPISYSGRTYQEGKKINWRDGARAVGAILRFALSDEIYRKDAYGSQILARLSRAPRFNAWMADVIRPFCGNRVLEIGGGVGNLTLELVPRWTFVVSDINPLYLQTLNSLRHQRPYLDVQYCDVTDITTFSRPPEGFDTAICLNVIEHIAADRQALQNIRSVLAPEGRAIILVPQGQWNYGTLDEVLGHERRYSRETLTRLAHDSGFHVEHLFEFNRVGTIAWFINGRLLRRRSFSLPQIKLLNWMVPLMRPLDGILPTPPLSLIAILRPAPAADAVPGHERPSPDSMETRPPAETGRQAASVSGLR
jgi:glycosyltransferase involved in cell wall biosynthesis